MARYVFLMKASQSGAANILWQGPSGGDALMDSFKDVGATVHELCTVTGDYDAMVLADMPSDAAVLGISNAINAGGFYVDTLRTFTRDEVEEARSLVGVHAVQEEYRRALEEQNRSAQAETE